MDDEDIRRITQEVLADLVRPAEADTPGVAGLEGRVQALEAAVRGLRGGSGPAVAAAIVVAAERSSHPSLTLLEVAGGARQCLMEPDKPCVQSGACRTFGH
jgi:hypothetical protein